MSLERAYLLYEQSRYAQAEQEVRRSLTYTPQDAEVHALLALCLIKQNQYAGATEAAETAVHLSPDWSFPHYALAVVRYERNQYAEAEWAIAHSIRLNPNNEAHYALQSALAFDQQQWEPALSAAERGLRLDPKNSSCLNLRAAALVKLNRTQEAADSIQVALQQHPTDAATHANQGWVLLEQRNYSEAMQSFREALRLNPSLEWARQGVIYTLKARNPLYGWMLRYSLWMAKLTPRVRWGVILGGWALMQVLRRIARYNPDLTLWFTPILVFYLLFVYFTWIADPLFNLLLRLDRYGRLILSEDERVASNWVGSLLGGAIAALLLGVLLNTRAGFAVAAVLGLLVIPVAAIFSGEGSARRIMAVYAIALALLGFLGLVMAAVQQSWGAIALLPLSLFLIGVLASSFLANLLVQQTPQK